MKKLVRIITAEVIVLWVLSGLTIGCDSWIPFWVFIATTIYLSFVAHATFEWKEKDENNENTGRNTTGNQQT